MISFEDRYCPLANEEIDNEVCYEIIMCLTSGFNPDSVPEVDFKKNEKSRQICERCPYSKWE